MTPEPCCISWSNPLTWFSASLIFIGCLLGGSHAAITLDGASIVSGGLSTLPVADFALRHTDRLVSSRCQGCAWGDPPFDVSRSLLSLPCSNASGPESLLSGECIVGSSIPPPDGMQTGLSAPAVKGVLGENPHSMSRGASCRSRARMQADLNPCCQGSA